jgi:transcription elongation factor Elf1
MLTIMGRKRRKVIKIFKKTLPKILSCPRCGNISLILDRSSEDTATIKCGVCKLNVQYPAPKRRETIDIYNEFVDKVHRGEIQI